MGRYTGPRISKCYALRCHMYKMIYLFALVVSTSSFAQTECTPNSIGYDVCNYGKKLASEMAPSLPMQLNKNMSLESIMAFKTTVQLIAQLHFDKKYLVELYAENGLKLSDFEKAMTKSLDSMCAKGNPVGAFINLGGKLRYVYRFSDGEQFLTVEKTSCE